jgi:hypothetical protein
MIRLVFFIAALVALPFTLTAQGTDSLLSSASEPLTEAQFLTRYPASDSNRVLIKHWFHRRNAYRKGLPFFGAAMAIGLVGVISTSGSSTDGTTLFRETGVGLLVTSALPVIVCVAQTVRLSNSRLAQVLEHKRTISAQRWREAFRHEQRQYWIRKNRPIPE